MKKHFFWIIIGLISISFILNTIYAESKQLSEPIFLEHYIEVEANEYPTFYYITNSDDPTTVSYVEMAGITTHVIQDNVFYDLNDSGPSILNNQTFNHYAVRSFQLVIDSFYLQEEFKNGKISFDELTIYFNDGTEFITPIGQVVINENDNNSNFLDSYATTNSTNAGLTYSYRAETNLTIENINMTFEELFKDEVMILLNIDPEIQNRNPDEFKGEDISNIDFPVSIAENQLIQLHNSINPNLIKVINFPIYISGITKDDEKFTSYSWVNNQPFSLTKEELDQIIDENSRGRFK